MKKLTMAAVLFAALGARAEESVTNELEEASAPVVWCFANYGLDENGDMISAGLATLKLELDATYMFTKNIGVFARSPTVRTSIRICARHPISRDRIPTATSTDATTSSPGASTTSPTAPNRLTTSRSSRSSSSAWWFHNLQGRSRKSSPCRASLTWPVLV